MKNWQRIKSDPVLKQKLKRRSVILKQIREFFDERDFLEVDTPLLVKHPGTEPYLEVFETTLQVQNQPPERAFLTTSPELSMKKLLSSGIGSIYQICKSFRNQEGLSDAHNPEFTILEWYRTPGNYQDIMSDCEELLLHLNGGLTNLTYQGKNYDLSTPWERISVAEAFKTFAGINVETLLDEQKLIEAAVGKGYAVGSEATWEQVYHQIFLNEIEPQLGQSRPTIVYDYPASQAALSKKKESDPRFAERFEFYLAGFELGNAFSELADAKEQRERMLDDLSERQNQRKTEYELDQDFILALESGLPETGGIAVGVDRLIMLFSDAASVQETLFFPIEDIFDFN